MPDCKRKERAVSELIGAILLVGLVITAMAIVAVLLLSNPPPEEVPQLNALAGNDTASIYLYHTGGDELKEEQTLIRINNNPTPISHDNIQIKNDDGTITQWANSYIPWSVGKTLIIPSAEIPQSVSIVYQGSTSQNLILTTTFVATSSGSSGGGSIPTCSPVNAGFTSDKTSGSIPLTVQFTDTSTSADPITSRLWNFGDGTTSTQINPTHTYTTAGDYTVILTSTNTCGESDTFTSSIEASAACGSVSGIVFNDLNGNSQRDPEEPGLSGWTVGVFSAPSNIKIKETTTDQDGYFILSNLIYPGVYYVEAEIESSYIQTYPTTDQEDIYGGYSGGNEYKVNLGPLPENCYKPDLNFGYWQGTKGTYYLHNNPTPPVGSTTSQANLPISSVAPTATTLYNYDTDRDSFPGRLIQKGGGDSTIDLGKYQNWRIAAPSQGIHIYGDVQLVIHSGIKNFDTNPSQRTKRGYIRVYLREISGSGNADTFATQSLNRYNWHGGLNQWMEDTITFTNVDRVIQSGHSLEMKIVVYNDSADDMWFAYDTMSYPARLVLT